ncbi:MAG: hypothetical protein SRB2_01097 [Desulfobacteraceae bacterium Eth-SRB2]|nr:MAG: hypothetical protein SRB2_01097 [Desulfobacteraceae bacterium Eth-SRB2]
MIRTSVTSVERSFNHLQPHFINVLHRKNRLYPKNEILKVYNDILRSDGRGQHQVGLPSEVKGEFGGVYGGDDADQTDNCSDGCSEHTRQEAFGYEPRAIIFTR